MKWNGAKTLGVVFTLVLATESFAADYYDPDAVVTTYAGSGFYGFLDGTGTQTMFNQPAALVVDGMTNVIVWDNQRLRKIDAQQVVSTFAGSGANGQGDGIGEDASFIEVTDICLLPSGDFAMVDWNYIRIMTPQAVVTTLVDAGGGFGLPLMIAADSQGTIFVADGGNRRISKVDANGNTTTFAGSGNAGLRDGTGIFSSFNDLAAIAVNAVDEIFVIDRGNWPDGEGTVWLRKITQAGEVTTLFSVVGSSGLVFLDDGGIAVLNPFGVDAYDMSGLETRLAGILPAVQGYQDGSVESARFRRLAGMAIGPDRNLYLADKVDHRIRKVTLSGSPLPEPVNLSASLFAGVTINGRAGETYSIEATETLDSTEPWVEVERIALPVDDYVWIDRSTSSPKRFYRARLIR